MILLWLIVAFGGGTWYFKWVPDSYAATGDEQPFWVQVCLPAFFFAPRVELYKSL